MRKRQWFKRALAFTAVIYIPLSLAQTSNLETSPPEIAAVPTVTNAMTWPMLPGENITALAALFYPDNPHMQKRFIVKTLQLSREIDPQLTAESASNQASLIIIPNLKSLAKPTGKIRSAKPKHQTPWSAPLKMSYGLKDAALFVVSDALQAQYTALAERNASLKLQLEKLNTRLAQLQQTLAALGSEAKRLLTGTSVTDTSINLPAPTAKSAHHTNPGLIQPNGALQPIPVEVKLLNIAPVKTADGAFNLLLLLPLLLLAILLAGLARWYTYQRSKQLYLASVQTFDPISLDTPEPAPRRAIDEVDFSLTQSGLTSMSVTDLGQFESLEDEDGDLSLEQARIYAHIDRIDEAIELLKAHIERTPKTALHHWLYLLDIYRDTDQREAFMHYAEKLHQTFNVMLPLWENKPLPMIVASSIEEFPHLVQPLTALWGDPSQVNEAQAFLDTLLTDNRNSIRTGFSMEVFQEILLLKGILSIRDKLYDAINPESNPQALELG